MAKPHLERLPAFTTIGWAEKQNVLSALRMPLSGYIGGVFRGGYWVERLSEEWKTAFKVKHAIPCNSATSGLMAASAAAGLDEKERGINFITTPYSMSATTSCAKFIGAEPVYVDIETTRFGIDPGKLERSYRGSSAVIVTNLFGHPSYLTQIRSWCDSKRIWMIEDNAQAPFAMEGGQYTGTIGHMGVFSLNVHKHIQCGEGGVIVTNDGDLADNLRNVINHGELAEEPSLGLNLRMTEPIAAIACAQLERAKPIVESRREIALALNDIVKPITWIKAHEADEGCKHVYYLWTAIIPKTIRTKLVDELNSMGVPIRAGYAPLLNKLFRSSDKCPMAEHVDEQTIVFEVCAYDVKARHLKTMRDIFMYAAERVDADRAA